MKIIKRMAVTVFLLSLLDWFLFGGERWIIFCFCGALWLLFWEIMGRIWSHKEWRISAYFSIFIFVLVFIVFVLLAGARYREWMAAVLQEHWREGMVILFVGVFTLVLSLLENKLLILAPFCFLGVLIIAIWELPVHRLGIIGALYFSFFSIMEYAGLSFYGKGIGKKMSGFFWIPLCLCICLAVLPVSEKPYPYAALRQLWAQVREGALVIYTELSLLASRRNSDFYVQFTGYSEEGAVGGSLLRSNKPAMLLTVSGSLKGNLYLAGNIQNHYENNRWTFVSDTFLEEELTMDTLEFLYAVWQFSLESEKDIATYFVNSSASVTYQGLYTKDLFFPPKFCGFRQLEKYQSHKDKLVAPHAKKEGDSYGFRYLTVNYGSEELRELIQSRREILYQEKENDMEFVLWLNKNYPQLRRAVPEQGLETALLKRREEIYRDYMQIPESLYPQMKELADRLTADKGTDLEKLQAIERYLQGFTYTRTPGEPKGDAVYEFLFHTGEGYCTYFASAFVLLSRASGIPARYVNGFCIPVYTEGKREYLVESSCAHAWPEAYLTGVGWLSFEPTAGYGNYHSTPWHQESNVHQEMQTTQVEDRKEAFPEEMEEEWDEILLPSAKPSEAASFVKWLMVLCFFLLVFALLVFCLIRLHRRKERYQKSSVEGRITWLLCYEMALLRAAGIGRQRNETLLLYGQRVASYNEALVEAGVLEFLALYMESFYGGVALPLEAEVFAKECVRKTEQFYIDLNGEKRQRWRKFYIVYLWFTFSENMI